MYLVPFANHAADYYSLCLLKYFTNLYAYYREEPVLFWMFYYII